MFLVQACSSKDATIEVIAVTGLVAGPEFRIVSTTLLDETNGQGGSHVLQSSESVARTGVDFASGRSVASFSVPKGNYRVRVRLLRPSGTFLIERTIAVTVAGNTALRVHLTRDCVGVTCPVPGGSDLLSTCLAGRCVDPRCTVGTPEYCPSVQFCASAGECDATAECAQSVCDEGVCVQTPRASTCASSEWCNPDVGVGCQPLDPPTPNDGVPCGTICTLPGRVCEYGYLNCNTDAAPFCDALGARPSSVACDVGRVCDEVGECVTPMPTEPGITVLPTAGLVTTEDGGTASFSVVLTSRPTGTVFILVSSSDATEGHASPTALAFTDTNWNAPQTVTVTGVGDVLMDGNQVYQIITAAAVSTDSDYSGMNASDVEVTNVDDASAGVTVSRLSGLETAESGGSDTFSIALNTMPTSDVTISLSSSDASEAAVSPSSLTFTSANYASPQIVTVTGVDDATQDGDQTFRVVTSAASSVDTRYDSLDVPDVDGVNRDDETAGILVIAPPSLTTSETGTSVAFMLVLQAEPAANVTIALSSSDTSEGTVSPTIFIFTTANWNVPRTVTVRGIDDAVLDGDQIFRIRVGPATSPDPAYQGLSGPDVTITNADNETPHVDVSPVGGIVTTEVPGAPVPLTISLSTMPTGDISLSVLSSNTAEGTVFPTSVVFTTGNWDTPQTVMVTGVDDAVADGARPYEIVVHIVSTTDTRYAALADKHISATNIDNDVPGVHVTPTTGLMTDETGATAVFNVYLDTQPTAPVTVALVSNDPSEARISVSSLTFTPSTYADPQSVTVTGVTDGVRDGDIGFVIITGAAVSTDGGYNGLAVPNVSGTNRDIATPGIVVTAAPNLTTSESGTTATFSIRLLEHPLANVTIPFVSTDTSEGTTFGSTTFAPLVGNLTFTFQVVGVDDALLDGDQPYTIHIGPATSTDPGYNGLSGADILVVNIDDDTPHVNVLPSNPLTTTEAGGTDTFTMTLSAAPASNVTVLLSSSNTQEGTVSPSSLVFTPGDWNVPHVGTVTGVNDHTFDASIAYSVITSNAMSSDPQYNGRAVADVAVVNTTAARQQAYLKASNAETLDVFGAAVAISADGNTIAAASTFEASAATGIGGNQADNSAPSSGAVYIYTRSGTSWSQQAYVKASNAEAGDGFGGSLALSADGNTLVVGALSEASSALGVGGNQSDNAAPASGAAYVLRRTGTTWSQQAYLKASNTFGGTQFAAAVGLSAAGDVLAVGSAAERSGARGVDGNQSDRSFMSAGAVYMFRFASGAWIQEAYLKASNTDAGDTFGGSLALSGDGLTLAVSASSEDSNAVGPGGEQSNNSYSNSGAVYLFHRDAAWHQTDYIKASNTGLEDRFGSRVALSSDGHTLAVAAWQEGSNALGINGDQMDNSGPSPGAVYVFNLGSTWSQQAYIKSSAGGQFFGTSLSLTPDGNNLAVGASLSNGEVVDIGNWLPAITQPGALFLFRRAAGAWSQNAVVRSRFPNPLDAFASACAIANDGHTIVVGAPREDGSAAGTDESDNSLTDSGAVFIFVDE